MKIVNRPLFKGILLVLLAAMLLSCGGKEERKVKYLERGKVYLAEKNYDKARIEFKNVLQIDPKDAQGYLYLGKVEEKTQSWSKAFGNYKKALELDPELIEPRVRLAQFYLAQASALRTRENADGAANALGLVQEQIREIRAREPDNTDALTLEASLWFNDGDTDKALTQLEGVIARDPGLSAAAMLLASLYDQKGRTADAEAVLVKAAAVNPEPVLLQQRLAAHYARNKQADQAEAVLRQIVRENPDELGHRVSLASFLSRAEKIDKAAEVLSDAIAADPEDAQRYLLLTQLLASRKSPDAAMEQLQTFIAQKPEMPELRMALVKLYLTNQQKDKARQLLEQIIDRQKLEPAGLKARVTLAQLLASESMDDERVPDLLKQVLDENPRDNEALLLKGRIAAYRKDYIDAVNDFRSVLRDQPNNAEVLRFLALAHLGNNDNELALDVLRRGVESNPESSLLRLSLAQLLTQSGDTDAALEQVDAILKVDSTNQQALENKFSLLARKGDTEGMDAVARLMQEGSPDSDAGFVQEARLRLAQKEYGAATEILDRVLATHPLSVSALSVKSDVLVAQQKYPEAMTVVEQLQKAEPDSAQGFFRMGRLLDQQNDVPGAIEQYEIALQKAPTSAEVLTTLVGLEVRQGKSVDAVQRLQAILEKNPDHPSANELLGVVYLGSKDFAKAEAAFQRQVELNPDSSTVYNQLAQARVGAGDLDGAGQAFEAGLTQIPGDIRLLVGLAGVRERQQAYDEAIALYEKVLETQPDNAISTNNLAALLADHRRDAASLARAVELSGKLETSGQPAFQDTAAWVYYRKGEYDKAAGILQKVVEVAPNVPVFQYHLGMVYYQQGDKAAARDYLTRATTGDDDYPGVEEARATLKIL